MSRAEKVYCDNCGDSVPDKKRCYVERLPVNIDSANEGESAVLCPGCFKGLPKAAHIGPSL